MSIPLSLTIVNGKLATSWYEGFPRTIFLG